MKHIKPGRGPSMMGGVAGVFMIGFGIVWTIMASQTRPFFALFGIFWTCMAIATTIYNFKNATGKNRYSQYDITDSAEEPDPFNERFGQTPPAPSPSGNAGSAFCPYCGAPVDGDYKFCNKCGKELP